ncbi:CHAT domain-containing protein [Mycena pura]|uniref:CHAT domain-containing protein n=1 Tax=Mycena pura TaxID=153505 RepID=A0AAD6V7Q7_9AGAR|nr:CHAT domain-containing protein [Mycena pura]
MAHPPPISNISGWEEEEEVHVPGSSRALASLRRSGLLDRDPYAPPPPLPRGGYLPPNTPSGSLQSRLIRDHQKGRRLANTSTELARGVEPAHLYADWESVDSEDDDLPPKSRPRQRGRSARNLDTRSLDARLREAVSSQTTPWSPPHSDDDDEPPVRRHKGPDRLWNLAMAYSHQYDKYADMKDLEGVIKNKALSIQLTHDGHPQRAARLQSLAASFMQRFHRLEELQDIDTAIRHLQQALKLTEENDPDLHLRVAGLALAFSRRYDRLGASDDLDTALNHGQASILLAPSGYRREGNLDDLELSLEKSREASILVPIVGPERPGHLEALASTFLSRFKRWGDPDDLNSAIQNNRAALESTAPKDRNPDYNRRLHQLALSLGHRYERAARLSDLNSALRHMESAVLQTQKGHPELPGYLTTLGRLYEKRYDKSKDLQDLDAGIECHQKSVHLTPEDHPDRPSRLHGWGIALSTRQKRLKRIEDLNNLMEAHQEAVVLCAPDHPDLPQWQQGLASAFCQRYTRLQDTNDLGAAFENYSLSFGIAGSAPVQSWNAALDYASLAHRHKPREELKAYSHAFKLLPEILWMGNSLNVHQEWSQRINIAAATSDAVRACLAHGDTHLAIELLEQGMATAFQRLLQLKPDIQGVPQALADQLQSLSSQLYSGTAKNSQRLAVERNQILEKIRALDGLRGFLLPRPYSELRQASKHGPVVILNSHETRCDSLILMNPDAEPFQLELKGVTLRDLEQHRAYLKEILARSSITVREPASTRLKAEREGSNSKPTQERFCDLLAWLWTNVVEHIYKALKSHGIHQGRLWWCPTGAFTRLPLHAAAVSDDFIQSYISTPGTLLDAGTKRSNNNIPPKIGAVGVTYSGPGRHAALPSVAKEIHAIITIVGENEVEHLLAEQATIEGVKMQLLNCSWLHLACHGQQNIADPPKSCLKLYDGNLELEAILRMPLPNAELVFLAACQTAMGDASLVNESFHLAGGFIAAGFRAAIATMWSMLDEDGPAVAEDVYTCLFGNGRTPQTTDSAKALQLAVRKMRDRGVPYERWVPFIHLGV